ncbi:MULTISPECIES: hypothetical protein [unclassified Haloarcula]|uniref:hypothetical protein n=1 Tax=unclassified Haloarcula TaxID=2624677 RepID=UPI00177D04A6|nr:MULTISPECIES: hypothetical protein [unclassified Haloarcula]
MDSDRFSFDPPLSGPVGDRCDCDDRFRAAADVTPSVTPLERLPSESDDSL